MTINTTPLPTKKGEFRVLILAAMPKEYSMLTSWLENPHVLASFDTQAHIGKIKKAECLTVTTGIGKVNAAVRTYHAQLPIMTCGAAKAINSDKCKTALRCMRLTNGF